MNFSFSFRPDRYKNTGHVFFLYKCIKTNMNFYGRVQKKIVGISMSVLSDPVKGSLHGDKVH